MYWFLLSVKSSITTLKKYFSPHFGELLTIVSATWIYEVAAHACRSRFSGLTTCHRPPHFSLSFKVNSLFARACGRTSARADTYDIINARVRLSWCLYSRRYYETPSENVLRFVSPFILFCFNWMVGAKSGHTYMRTFTIATCGAHAPRQNIESSSRVTFAFFLLRGEFDERHSAPEKFQFQSNSSARYKQGFSIS